MTEESPYPGLYMDHPVRPVEPRDPLDFFAERQRLLGGQADARRLRLAYAARWEAAPEHTWSGSALSLLARMREVADTDDIGVHFPGHVRGALRMASARYQEGGIRSAWANSRLTNAYLDRTLSRSFGAARYDAALTIDSLAVLPDPFFVYYDTSWDSLLTTADTPERYMRNAGVTPARMARMVQRQRAIYEKATAIFTMSHWFARSLVEESGVPASKIHTIHPGVNTPRVAAAQAPLSLRPAPRRRLLFVGRQWGASTFYAKGGELVIDAFKILRAEYDPRLTLTLAGVTYWPLAGPVPDGVTLAGVLPPSEVRKMYDSHDLLVVPSRIEGFGIVFAEAASRAMPSIARNAYAMPEVVVPGLSGGLIDNSDPQELASAIVKALEDDQLYEACLARAPRIAEYFSWDRAAWEIRQIITQSISGTAAG